MKGHFWKPTTYYVIVTNRHVIRQRLQFNYSTINPPRQRLVSFRLLVFARILSREVKREVTQQRVF